MAGHKTSLKKLKRREFFSSFSKRLVVLSWYVLLTLITLLETMCAVMHTALSIRKTLRAGHVGTHL